MYFVIKREKKERETNGRQQISGVLGREYSARVNKIIQTDPEICSKVWAGVIFHRGGTGGRRIPGGCRIAKKRKSQRKG